MNRLDSIINRRVKKKHLKNGEALSWRRALVSIYVWKREREKKEIFFFKCKAFYPHVYFMHVYASALQ